MIKDANGGLLYAFSDNLFVGKTLALYGDSQTAGNNPYRSKPWYSWVQDILGFSTIINHASSGDTTCNTLLSIQNNTDNADVIIVMTGTNDASADNRLGVAIPLGQEGDTTGGTGASSPGTTYGNFYQMCNVLRQKYPTKLILFVTKTYSHYSDPDVASAAYRVNKAIRYNCEVFAIPYYDNFFFAGFSEANLVDYWTADGAHWNDKGHELVGKNMSSWIATHFRYLYREG